MASPVRIYFRLAFALTWGIGGIALLAGRWMPGSPLLAPSSPLYYVAAYSVSVVGVALTAWYGGRAGLRQLGQRLLPWRSAPHWYLVVVLCYAAITILAGRLASLFGSIEFALPGWTLVLSATSTALLKDPGPIGEEFGWRGFALPRLLERFTPLTASVTLGLVHTAWHLPLFFIAGMPQTQASFPLFTLGVVAIAVFDTALYLRTGANLLLAILVHLMANVFGGMAAEAGALSFFFVAEGIAAVLIVGAGGLRSTHSFQNE